MVPLKCGAVDQAAAMLCDDDVCFVVVLMFRGGRAAQTRVGTVDRRIPRTPQRFLGFHIRNFETSILGQMRSKMPDPVGPSVCRQAKEVFFDFLSSSRPGPIPQNIITSYYLLLAHHNAIIYIIKSNKRTQFTPSHAPPHDEK
jgi:hypothetical protein